MARELRAIVEAHRQLSALKKNLAQAILPANTPAFNSADRWTNPLLRADLSKSDLPSRVGDLQRMLTPFLFELELTGISATNEPRNAPVQTIDMRFNTYAEAWIQLLPLFSDEKGYAADPPFRFTSFYFTLTNHWDHPTSGGFSAALKEITYEPEPDESLARDLDIRPVDNQVIDLQPGKTVSKQCTDLGDGTPGTYIIELRYMSHDKTLIDWSQQGFYGSALTGITGVWKGAYPAPAVVRQPYIVGDRWYINQEITRILGIQVERYPGGEFTAQGVDRDGVRRFLRVSNSKGPHSLGYELVYVEQLPNGQSANAYRVRVGGGSQDGALTAGDMEKARIKFIGFATNFPDSETDCAVPSFSLTVESFPDGQLDVSLPSKALCWSFAVTELEGKGDYGAWQFINAKAQVGLSIVENVKLPIKTPKKSTGDNQAKLLRRIILSTTGTLNTADAKFTPDAGQPEIPGSSVFDEFADEIERLSYFASILDEGTALREVVSAPARDAGMAAVTKLLNEVIGESESTPYAYETDRGQLIARIFVKNAVRAFFALTSKLFCDLALKTAPIWPAYLACGVVIAINFASGEMSVNMIEDKYAEDHGEAKGPNSAPVYNIPPTTPGSPDMGSTMGTGPGTPPTPPACYCQPDEVCFMGTCQTAVSVDTGDGGD